MGSWRSSAATGRARRWRRRPRARAWSACDSGSSSRARAVLLRGSSPSTGRASGARSATGRQWMSWICARGRGGRRSGSRSGEDWLSGPVNAVSPMAVMNVGVHAGARADLRAPAVRARSRRSRCASRWGRSPTRRVLASTHVIPAKLLSSGYPFRYSISGGCSVPGACHGEGRVLNAKNMLSIGRGIRMFDPFQWRRRSSSLSRTAWRSATSATCSTASRGRVSR